MSKAISLGLAGLMTDGSAINSPPGALRQADDIIIDRPGVASQRPTFGYVASKSTSQRPRSMFAWLSPANVVTPVVASLDGSTWKIETTGGVIDTTAEPLNSGLSFPQFATARDNLYYTTTKGLRKATATNATGARAGMHEATSGLPSVVTSGTPVVLANNMATAWRWCFKKIDANGVETRSAPSPWSTMSNTSGSTVDMQWIIPLPDYVAASDQLELYRAISVSSASVPADTMYLAVKHLVTSADVTNGYATVTDRTAEAALGQELYTNPSRDGALKSNGRPPACVALSLWSDCVWFGGVRGPYTSVIDIVTVTGATTTDGLTGLQRLRLSGDCTSGSPTITGLASTTSVKTGQLVTDGGIPGATSGNIPVGARVISKTGTTVTMDANATGTAVAINFFFHDGLTVDALTYWVGTAEIIDASYPTFVATIGNRERGTARSLAYVISRVSAGLYAFAVEDPYYRNADGSYTQASVVIRSRELDDSSWSVTVIADTTSSPPAVQFVANASGGVLVRRDDYPNAVMYSKPAEPEHVPDLNFIFIGDENAEIVGMAALPSALIVAKRDGIFRVTGSAPDGWRVDCLEPRARAFRGECLGVLGEAVYVWTDLGILRVTVGGAENVSSGRVGRALDALAQYWRNDRTTTALWVTTWRRRNLVIVGVPSAAADTDATYAYVFCEETGAWVRWTIDAWCAAESEIDGNLYLARGGAFFETRKGSDFTGYDRAYASLTWTTVGTTLTITDANRGDWTPEAGDWVSCVISGSTEYRRATASVDAGTSYTVTLASAFSSDSGQSSCTAYEGVTSKIHWQGKSVVPTNTARMRRIHSVMDWSAYAGSVGGSTARLLCGVSTDRSGTIAEGTNAAVVDETRSARIAVIDTTPSRSVSRASLYMPYLETDDIGLEWRCLGVTMEIDDVSERADR